MVYETKKGPEFGTSAMPSLTVELAGRFGRTWDGDAQLSDASGCHSETLQQIQQRQNTPTWSIKNEPNVLAKEGKIPDFEQVFFKLQEVSFLQSSLKFADY